MTKADLNEKCLLKFRNGMCGFLSTKIYGYVVNYLRHATDEKDVIMEMGCFDLDEYSNNLNHSNPDYDIIAIRKTYLSQSDAVAAAFAYAYIADKVKWDWERPEHKEVTMAEIEEKFGCKVKIVKDD